MQTREEIPVGVCMYVCIDIRACCPTHECFPAVRLGEKRFDLFCSCASVPLRFVEEHFILFYFFWGKSLKFGGEKSQKFMEKSQKIEEKSQKFCKKSEIQRKTSQSFEEKKPEMKRKKSENMRKKVRNYEGKILKF